MAVENTNFDYLNHLLLQPVEVSILDEDGDDKAPFISKRITNLELCPDKTHLRVYFDGQNFFAIPLTSEVTIAGDEWSAVDSQKSLKYVIRRVRES